MTSVNSADGGVARPVPPGTTEAQPAGVFSANPDELRTNAAQGRSTAANFYTTAASTSAAPSAAVAMNPGTAIGPALSGFYGLMGHRLMQSGQYIEKLADQVHQSADHFDVVEQENVAKQQHLGDRLKGVA